MKRFILICIITLAVPVITNADTKTRLTSSQLESTPEIKVSKEIIKDIIGEFSGQGWIDQINSNNIIINDTIFKLSSKLKKLDIKGNISTQPLKHNMHVYYLLGKNKKIIKIIIGRFKI